VRVDPAARVPPGGAFHETLKIKGVEPGGRSVEIVVPVLFGLYVFEGPAEFVLPTTPPGFQVSASFEARITPAVDPLDVRCDKLSGPGGDVPVTLRVEKSAAPGGAPGSGGEPPKEGGAEPPKEGGAEAPAEGGAEPPKEGGAPAGGGPGAPAGGEAPAGGGPAKPPGEGGPAGAPPAAAAPAPPTAVLKVTAELLAGKALAEGEYRGTVTIAGPGDPPLVREIPIRVTIAWAAPEAKVEPASLVLSAKAPGWVEAPWTVALATPFPCEVSMTPEPLVLRGAPDARGAIFKEFDIRLVPEEGWTGDRMEGGKSYRCRFRVYVSPNLGRGTYAGSVAVEIKGQGKATRVVIPVELTVE
jgi:hypothetical protein